MEQLIARVADAVGIDANTADQAIKLILGFLQKEGDASAVSSMFAQLPGAADAAAEGASQLGGGFMGGGVMGLGQKLMGLGLGMGEITGVAKETIAFAKENGDSAIVDQVVGSIPGLGQFV